MINQSFVGVFILVLTSLVACVADQSTITINTSIGTFTGFKCTNNTCDYICFGPHCRDYTNPKEGIKQFLQCGIKCGWGIGAAGKDGCNGANCGYWGGCKNDICTGYFDFRQCDGPFCISGPFQGYFCKQGQCPVVCRGNMCHWNKYYGKHHDCDTNCKTGPFEH
ncbi:hypothetical protein Aperf_G00000118949 [Anoplocephala perfoliata]